MLLYLKQGFKKGKVVQGVNVTEIEGWWRRKWGDKGVEDVLQALEEEVANGKLVKMLNGKYNIVLKGRNANGVAEGGGTGGSPCEQSEEEKEEGGKEGGGKEREEEGGGRERGEEGGGKERGDNEVDNLEDKMEVFEENEGSEKKRGEEEEGGRQAGSMCKSLVVVQRNDLNKFEAVVKKKKVSHYLCTINLSSYCIVS